MSGSSRALAARATWAMADQVVSSATNFALGILVARSASPSEFGAFSLVFWLYLVLLATARALSSQPLIVSASHVPHAAWADATAAATGASFTLGILGGLIVAAIGIAAGPAGGPAVAMGLGMAALLVQDGYRYALVAAGRTWGALVSDLTWATVMIVLIVGFGAAGKEPSATESTVVWVVGAVLAALAAATAARVAPLPRATARWVRGHRSVIPGFVAAGLAETIILTIRQFALAALAGLAVVGALRASMLVFAPISVAHQGVSLIAAPEASRVRRRNPARFVPWLAGLSLSLTAGAALAAAVLVNMPDAVGVALLGENWWAAKPILVPQAVVMVVLVATNGPGTGLVVLGAARRLAYLTAWTKILGTGFVLVGGVTAAATGAAWASVGEQAVNLGALTRSFRSALREDAADSAPASSS